MIPLLAEMQVQRRGRPALRLWLPLFLLWLVLLPVAVVLLPFGVLGWAVTGRDPRAIAAFFGLFAALAGTHVEVEAPAASVLIRII